MSRPTAPASGCLFRNQILPHEMESLSENLRWSAGSYLTGTTDRENVLSVRQSRPGRGPRGAQRGGTEAPQPTAGRCESRQPGKGKPDRTWAARRTASRGGWTDAGSRPSRPAGARGLPLPEPTSGNVFSKQTCAHTVRFIPCPLLSRQRIRKRPSLTQDVVGGSDFYSSCRDFPFRCHAVSTEPEIPVPRWAAGLGLPHRLLSCLL